MRGDEGWMETSFQVPIEGVCRLVPHKVHSKLHASTAIAIFKAPVQRHCLHERRTPNTQSSQKAAFAVAW